MHPPGLTDPEFEIIDDVDAGERVWLFGAPDRTLDDGSIRTAVLEPDGFRLPVADSVRRLADRTGAGVDSAVFRWSRRWARFARAGDIRAQSRIRLHAWTPLHALIDRLGDGPIEVHDRGRLILRSDEPLTAWKRGAYRAPATLSLRWSWPNLPVWVVAEPWWRDHSVVTLSLRSNHRFRYPRRYWDTAYRALRGVVLGGSG